MSDTNKLDPEKTEVIDKVLDDFSTEGSADQEETFVKEIDQTHYLIDGVRYELTENYRDAIDLEDLNKRYSLFFEKYDYIVGDYSRNQLRLRGFFDNDEKDVPIDMKISFLDEYLNEYCSFGCQYFVLKRLEEKKNFTPYQKNEVKKPAKRKPRKKAQGHKVNKNKGNQHKRQANRLKAGQQKTKESNKKGPYKKTAQTFVKKERKIKTEDSKSTPKEVKTVKDEKGRQKFTIHHK